MGKCREKYESPDESYDKSSYKIINNCNCGNNGNNGSICDGIVTDETLIPPNVTLTGTTELEVILPVEADTGENGNSQFSLLQVGPFDPVLVIQRQSVLTSPGVVIPGRTICRVRNPLNGQCILSDRTPPVATVPTSNGIGILSLYEFVDDLPNRSREIQLCVTNAREAFATYFLNRVDLARLSNSAFNNGTYSRLLTQAVQSYRNNLLSCIAYLYPDFNEAVAFVGSIQLRGRLQFIPS